MAQIYEYQDIDAHVILLFVHPALVNIVNSYCLYLILTNTGYDDL